MLLKILDVGNFTLSDENEIEDWDLSRSLLELIKYDINPFFGTSISNGLTNTTKVRLQIPSVYIITSGTFPASPGSFLKKNVH